jgi:hypothetical protein
MNFNALLSAVHLMVAFFVLCVGALFVAVSLLPHVRYILTDFLFSPKVTTLFYIGIAILVLGFLLFFGLYFLGRKRYFQIQMQCAKLDVDEQIIREYVSSYWKNLFSDCSKKVDVIVHSGRRLEIISEIPQLCQEEPREELLARIQNELGILLARRLGYEKEFILTLSEL